MEHEDDNVTLNRPLINKAIGDNLKHNVVDCTFTHSGTTHPTQLHVTTQGDKSAPHAMVTLHDVGLNSVSNYGPLINSEPMIPIVQKYCIYQIDLPGQEENAGPLPSGYVYPSMENLAEMIPQVYSHFGLESAVCIGTGAGANIFIRFAMKNPSLVEGLFLVNPTVSSVSNLSWFQEKITNIATPFSEKVLNYHFTKEELDQMDHDILEAHRKHFKQNMVEENVRMFFHEFEKRHEIHLQRSVDPQQADKTTLQCQTLILVGDMSPFVDDAIETNSRLNVKKSTFLKMADAGGMVLVEQVSKVTESLIYFLQGLGHIPGVIMTRLARSRTISASSIGSADGDKKRIRTFSGGSTGAPAGQVGSPVAQGMIGATEQSDKAQLVPGAVC